MSRTVACGSPSSCPRFSCAPDEYSATGTLMYLSNEKTIKALFHDNRSAHARTRQRAHTRKHHRHHPPPPVSTQRGACTPLCVLVAQTRSVGSGGDTGFPVPVLLVYTLTVFVLGVVTYGQPASPRPPSSKRRGHGFKFKITSF